MGARAKGTLVNILNKVLFRYTGFPYTILLIECDTFCQHSSIGDIDEEWDVKGKKHLLSNNADIDATKNNAIEHLLYVNFAQCWDEHMHFEHLSHLRQSRCKSKHLWLACVAGVKGVWGVGGGGGKKEKKGTPATRAASFAFRPLLQLFQLSLQRPIRIRRTLFCMTDFTWECITKGRFVAVEHEKIFATECLRRDSHKNL